MLRKNEWTGILLVVIGLILLLSKLGILTIGWGSIWPLFILVPGLALEASFFFNREIPGVLVPGGILTIIGLILFVCSIFGWSLMNVLWPFFPFSVAFGLFQLYVFGEHDKALLIPVGILGGVAVVSLVMTLVTEALGEIIPLLLILIGGYVFFLGRRSSHSDM